MKKLSLISMAVGLLAAGCGDNSSKSASGTNSATGGSVVTAPVDYLNAAAKAQQKAVKTVDTTSLDKAIQLFNVEKGRNPRDLNELVSEKYIREIPTPPYGTKIDYDANSGRVSVVKE
jgi:ABC-type glycerol-3-phosphate transport system substrate-binding protein